jgi:hypothetical protein
VEHLRIINWHDELESRLQIIKNPKGLITFFFKISLKVFFFFFFFLQWCRKVGWQRLHHQPSNWLESSLGRNIEVLLYNIQVLKQYDQVLRFAKRIFKS